MIDISKYTEAANNIKEKKYSNIKQYVSLTLDNAGTAEIHIPTFGADYIVLTPEDVDDLVKLRDVWKGHQKEIKNEFSDN